DQSPHFTTEETNKTINKMKRKHEAHSVLQKSGHTTDLDRKSMSKCNNNERAEKTSKNKEHG
uniref:Uncharacterized protein n=1 Tax=Sus scrofa TaxID=9823 RepID=A0A8D1V921_PIG